VHTGGVLASKVPDRELSLDNEPDRPGIKPVKDHDDPERGTRFTYDPGWLRQPNAVPISLTARSCAGRISASQAEVRRVGRNVRPPVIERVFGGVAAALPRAAAMVDGAPLSDDAKVVYHALLAERAASLA